MTKVFIKSLLILISFSPASFAQWEGAELVRLTYDTMQTDELDLYIDENDKLHMFYFQDYDPGWPSRDQYFYTTKAKNGNWTQSVEIGDTNLGFPSLYLDTKNGVIDALYPGPYYSSSVTNWVSELLDSVPGYYPNEHAIYRDTLGFVHAVWNIAYYDSSLGFNVYRVKYASNSTGTWVKQLVSPPVWIGTYDPPVGSFAVQSDGIAHILYWMYDTLGFCFVHTHNDTLGGTNWTTGDTIRITNGTLDMETIVDKKNGLHTIRWDWSGDPWEPASILYYYHPPGDTTGWSPPETVTASGSFRDFYLDGQNHPLIAFSGSRIKYAQRADTGWQITPILSYDSLVIYSFRFVLDSEGKGHAVLTAAEYGKIGLEYLEIYYYGPPCVPAMIADLNTDGRRTSADLVIIINHYFKNQPLPEGTNPCAADLNQDGQISPEDIVIFINYYFKGRTLPFLTCGC